MLRAPSRRKSKKPAQKVNLIPILDAVFIFIFFLLMSANFIKVYEIQSDVPIISTRNPPKNKKPPLALTLKIYHQKLNLYRGVPSRLIHTFGKLSDGEYDLEKLHNTLVNIKKRHKKEEEIIFEPKVDLEYEDIIKIMDSVRELRNLDDSIYVKDRDGIDQRVKTLFSKIVFGNIQS